MLMFLFWGGVCTISGCPEEKEREMRWRMEKVGIILYVLATVPRSRMSLDQDTRRNWVSGQSKKDRGRERIFCSFLTTEKKVPAFLQGVRSLFGSCL